MHMRSDLWSGSDLNPDDVAWVTEWLLACRLPWVPIGEESCVCADRSPTPDGRFWGVSIHAGTTKVRARLAVRDLARLIRWCGSVRDFRSLLRPPLCVRGSILGVTRVLRVVLGRVNPLQRMGYDG